ncbi:uncharacterized mitochondrial protein AtMg00810-like [Rutidosis leptorrhynchoides]|uniref:uncharacterized mitochondrial protein AtMg00810-like n=1 Tax=Rutidosis leptorrhynchoides TaxID=125765 RepID=UPI003A990561
MDKDGAFHVDDIILVTSSDALRDVLLSKLANEFTMKDLGPLSSFLGISVSRTPNGLFLNQSSYAQDIIQRAGLVSYNPAATPIDTSGKQSESAGNLYHDPTFYRSLPGAHQYLTFTRPDISYGTISLGLSISKSKSTSLVSYTDADWAGYPDTRRSTSGYYVYLV